MGGTEYVVPGKSLNYAEAKTRQYAGVKQYRTTEFHTVSEGTKYPLSLPNPSHRHEKKKNEDHFATQVGIVYSAFFLLQLEQILIS